MLMVDLVKMIFGDVKKLYQNFVHWNLSKLVYYVYGFLLALFGIIPFLILLLIVIGVSDLSITMLGDFLSGAANGFEVLGAVLANPLLSILGGMILLLAVLVGYIGVSYGEYLLYGLNFSYIKGKKSKILSKKRYFNLKFLWKYVCVGAWLTLFVVIPYIVYGLIFLAVMFYFGDPLSLHAYILSQPQGVLIISLFIGFIIAGLVSVYIAYRLGFSFLILADTKKVNTKAFTYIKKSSILTKPWGKLAKFLGVFILAFLVVSPVLFIGDYLDAKGNDLLEYRNFAIAEGQMGKQNLETTLSENNPELLGIYKLLHLEYGDMSVAEIDRSITQLQLSNMVYLILYFLFIYGLFHMVFSSFYIRELKGK